MKRWISLALCLLVAIGALGLGGTGLEVRAAGGMSLEELQAKYPHGTYWNGGNPDGWTKNPCTSHSTCNAYSHGGYQRAWQCFGFACQVGYLVYGTDPYQGWPQSTNKNAIDNLKAGDIVMITSNGYQHAIFVTAVDGNTVYYGDCNGDYRCGIRWGESTTKDFLKGRLINVRIAPSELVTSSRKPVDLGAEFSAFIMNKNQWRPVTATDTNAVIRTEQRVKSEIWRFTRLDDGSYKIINLETGFALDAESPERGAGANVGAWEYHGRDNQRWYIYGESEKYQLSPKNSNLVLDVYSDSREENANINLWDINNSTAQFFQIYKVTPGETTVSVTEGTSCTPTKFSWDAAHEAQKYAVKIWKDKCWEGELIEISDIEGLEAETVLPAGYYEAYIDSANEFDFQMSKNIVKFTVSDGHNFGNWNTTTPESCTEGGERERACLNCGFVEKESTGARGHSWNDAYTEDTPATCTEDGAEFIHCSVCGATKDSRAIQALGHSYGEWETVPAASCTSGGEKRTCSACGTMELRGFDEASHSFGTSYTVDKEPTCTQAGSESIHCANCDVTKDARTLPATGHSFGEWTADNAPTCTEGGSEKRICSGCEKTETRALPANGHSWGSTVTDHEASCTQSGYSSRHCTVCDAQTEYKTINAKGHSWQKTYTTDTAATESAQGSKSIHCSSCSAIKDSTAIPTIKPSSTVPPSPSAKPLAVSATANPESTATPEAKPEATPEAKPEATPETNPEATPEATPEANAGLSLQAKGEASPSAAPSAEPEATATPAPEATAAPTAEIAPGTRQTGDNRIPLVIGLFSLTAGSLAAALFCFIKSRRL